MKYYPHEEMLTKIPEDVRLQMAAWLDVSKQCHGKMVEVDESGKFVPDGGMCCLAVMEHNLQGWTREEMRHFGSPSWSDCCSETKHLSPSKFSNIFIENIFFAKNENNNSYGPAPLNDYFMTHRQIAQLLRGETVEIKNKA